MRKKIKIYKNKFVITNLVASGDIGLELDLHELVEKLDNIEYEPEQFPGAIMKFKRPHSTVLVFKNGKIVVVGCREDKVIKRVIIKAYKTLKPFSKAERFKFNPKKLIYEITNMVAAADLDLDLNLFTVAFELTDIEYEPEQFPGAIIKLRSPPVSVLLFKNGKIIIAGAKSSKQIAKAMEKTKKLIEKFDKKREEA